MESEEEKTEEMQKIREEKENFVYLVEKVFELLEEYEPIAKIENAQYIVKEAKKSLLESTNAIICKSACQTMGDCGHCQLKEIFQDLKETLCGKENTDEVQ